MSTNNGGAGGQATPQPKCTCCQSQNVSHPEYGSWECALTKHEGNFIQVVTKRWPLFDWAYRLFQVDNPPPEQCGYRINIAEMHRMYMRALQIDLINIGITLQFEKKIDMVRANKLEGVLTQAVRDYEFMTTLSQKPYDLFIASSERAQDNDILRVAMEEKNKSLASLDSGIRDMPISAGPWEIVPAGERASPIGGTRNASMETLLRQAFWWKLGAAVVGATFLVGPMWLLVFKRELFVQLGATTGFVFSFGLLLAFFVDQLDQVFAGTLAYAAVLMVFVGVTMQALGDS